MVELRLDGLMLLTFKKCKKHFPSGNQWKKLTRVVMVETTREGLILALKTDGFILALVMHLLSCFYMLPVSIGAWKILYTGP